MHNTYRAMTNLSDSPDGSTGFNAHPTAERPSAAGDDVSTSSDAAPSLSEYAVRLAIERVVREGIVVWDLDGRQTYVSDAFCELVGWCEEELVGTRPPFVYWVEDDAERTAKAFQRMLEGGAPSEGLRLRIRRKNGKRIDVLVAATPLTADDGSIQGILASVVEAPEAPSEPIRNRASQAIRSWL